MQTDGRDIVWHILCSSGQVGPAHYETARRFFVAIQVSAVGEMVLNMGIKVTFICADPTCLYFDIIIACMENAILSGASPLARYTAQ